MMTTKFRFKEGEEFAGPALVICYDVASSQYVLAWQDESITNIIGHTDATDDGTDVLEMIQDGLPELVKRAEQDTMERRRKMIDVAKQHISDKPTNTSVVFFQDTPAKAVSGKRVPVSNHELIHSLKFFKGEAWKIMHIPYGQGNGLTIEVDCVVEPNQHHPAMTAIEARFPVASLCDSHDGTKLMAPSDMRVVQHGNSNFYDASIRFEGMPTGPCDLALPKYGPGCAVLTIMNVRVL